MYSQNYLQQNIATDVYCVHRVQRVNVLIHFIITTTTTTPQRGFLYFSVQR